LGVVNSTKLQGTLGATNYVSLCNFLNKGAFNTQGLAFGT